MDYFNNNLNQQKAMAIAKERADYASQPGGLASVSAQNICEVAGTQPAILTGAQLTGDRADQLSALVSELERRIVPVLRSSAPQQAGNMKQEVAPNCSGMAEALFQHANRLSDICQRLSEIIDRVEL